MVHWSSTPFTNTPFGCLAIKSRRGDLETLTLDKQIIQTTRGDCLKSAITGFEQKNDSNAFLQLKKISPGICKICLTTYFVACEIYADLFYMLKCSFINFSAILFPSKLFSSELILIIWSWISNFSLPGF